MSSEPTNADYKHAYESAMASNPQPTGLVEAARYLRLASERYEEPAGADLRQWADALDAAERTLREQAEAIQWAKDEESIQAGHIASLELTIQQQAERIAEAERRVNEIPLAFLAFRNLEPEDACPACGGAGGQTYGNTSTWRRGFGGNMLTWAVCDQCWGSGHKDNPWLSHRQFQQQADTLTRVRAEITAACDTAMRLNLPAFELAARVRAALRDAERGEG